MFQNISSSTKGIILVNLAVLGFSLSNAFVKLVSDSISVGEILFFRSLFFFIPFYFYFVIKNKSFVAANSIFKTDKFWLQTFRGIIGAVGLLFIFYGFANLPLAEASALNFSTTLFVTVLSVPILKESVGWKRWLAVFVGFSGVLFIAQPSTGTFMSLSFLVAGIALLGAFLDSLSLVYNRLLSKTDSSLCILAHYSLWMLLVSFLFFLKNPVIPSLTNIILLMGVTVGSSFGQYAVTKAFSYAEASLISPFFYLLIAWGVLFGYLFWQEVPTDNVLFGSFIVICVSIFMSRNKKSRFSFSKNFKN